MNETIDNTELWSAYKILHPPRTKPMTVIKDTEKKPLENERRAPKRKRHLKRNRKRIRSLKDKLKENWYKQAGWQYDRTKGKKRMPVLMFGYNSCKG